MREFLAGSEVFLPDDTVGVPVTTQVTKETVGDLLDEKLSRRAVKDIQSGIKDPDRFDKWVELLQERVEAAPKEVQEVPAGPAGVFVGDPQLFGDPIVSDEEMRFYVDVYERTGFTGGLNWYRALRKTSTRPRAPTTSSTSQRR